MSVFLFTTCQAGFEPALKAELAQSHPDFRFSYSRKGFVTWKLPEKRSSGTALLDLRLESVFARAYGVSLGRTRHAAAPEVRTAFDDTGATRVHVWARDGIAFDAAASLVAQAVIALETRLPAGTPIHPGVGAAARPVPIDGSLGSDHRAARHPDPPRDGEVVLDVVLVGDNEWWMGAHRHAAATHRPWVGGVFPDEVPVHAPSRAWLKMAEGLLWPGLPVRAGETAVELGCAPGGAVVALLDRGLRVIGVDPADMAPSIVGDPRFTHLRKQSLQLTREDFAGREVQWLFSDMNVPADDALKAVSRFVRHQPPGSALRGAGITIKLKSAAQAPPVASCVERMKTIGFRKVRAVQLSQNRNEFWLQALR